MRATALILVVGWAVAGCTVDVRIGDQPSDAAVPADAEALLDAEPPDSGMGMEDARAPDASSEDAAPLDSGDLDAGLPPDLRLEFVGPIDAICMPALAALEGPLESHGLTDYQLDTGQIRVRLRMNGETLEATGEVIEQVFDQTQLTLLQLDEPSFGYALSFPLARAAPEGTHTLKADLQINLVGPPVGEPGLVRLHLADTASTATCTVEAQTLLKLM